MLKEKITQDDIILYEILRNPVLCTEFINNVDNDPKYDSEFVFTRYQREVLADFSSHVSMCTGRAVGKTQTLISLILWILVFKVFPDDYILYAVPSKVHLQPVWEGLLRSFRSNSFLSNFVQKGAGINSSNFSINTLNSSSLICRIAGQSGTGSNLVGLHTPFILTDEAGYFPWAAFTEMQPDLNTFTKGHREVVSGVPTGMREKNVLYHVDQENTSYSKMRVSAYDNPRITAEDIEKYKEQYGGETSDDFIHYVCFTEDAQVVTLTGYKKISDVRAGEYVLTHKGNYKRVNKLYKNKYSGDILEIKLEGSYKTLKVTPDHPFYAYKTKKVTWGGNKPYSIWKGNRGKKDIFTPGWIPAKELCRLDRLAFPNINYFSQIPSTVDFSKYGKVVGEYVYHESNGRNGSKKLTSKFKRFVDLDDEFLYFLGIFISEGSNVESRHQCAISLSEDEHYIIDRVINFLKSVNIKYYISNIKNSKGIQICFSSPIFSRFVSEHIGHGAKNKKIPCFLSNCNPTQLLPLVYGLIDGDGSVRKNRNVVTYTTISETLINQLRLILLSLGYNPSLLKTKGKSGVKIMGRTCNTNDSYSLEFCKTKEFYDFNRFDSGEMSTKIKNIKRSKFSGLVYNLEVEDDNSYVVENAAVHNCGQHGKPVFALFDRSLLAVESYPVLKMELDGIKMSDNIADMFTKIDSFPLISENNYGTVIGIDLGYTEPTAIIILYLDSKDRLKFHGRIKLSKTAYPIQEKLIDALDSKFKPSIIGMDAGNAGLHVIQTLKGAPEYSHKLYEKRLYPIDFSSSTSIGITADGSENKVKTKVFTVSVLQEYCNSHRIIFSHTDTEMITELERMTYTKNANGDISYRTLTERGGMKGDDHFTSALLCGVGAYYFTKEHNLQMPKQKLFRAKWT